MNGVLLARRTTMAPTGGLAAYPAAVLADNPGMYLRFQDGSGTTASDSSGNSHSATFTTAPTWNVAGPIGTDPTSVAITPNSSSRLFIPSATWMYNSSNRAGSAEGWFKLTATGGIYTIMERRASATPGTVEHFVLWVRGDSGNHIQGVVWNQLGSNVTLTSAATVNDGNWHYAVLSWTTDFGANTMQAVLYLDGSSAGSASQGDKVTADVAELTMTAENDGTRNFIGQLAELAYYPTVALTSTRVTAHWNAA